MAVEIFVDVVLSRIAFYIQNTSAIHTNGEIVVYVRFVKRLTSSNSASVDIFN